MNIEFKKDNNKTCTFATLKAGDLFQDKNLVFYMKINDCEIQSLPKYINAIDLVENQVKCFSQNAEIYPLNGKLIVDYT